MSFAASYASAFGFCCWPCPSQQSLASVNAPCHLEVAIPQKANQKKAS